MEETNTVVNNSGLGAETQVPEEVKRFSWGAFFLNWIWGIGNKSYLTMTIFASILTSFIPLIGAFVPLGLCIWFGFNGNEWAWRNKKWDSVEQFHEVQKKWAIWGIALAAVSIVMSILFTAIFGAIALQAAK